MSMGLANRALQATAKSRPRLNARVVRPTKLACHGAKGEMMVQMDAIEEGFLTAVHAVVLVVCLAFLGRCRFCILGAPVDEDHSCVLRWHGCSSDLANRFRAVKGNTVQLGKTGTDTNFRLLEIGCLSQRFAALTEQYCS